jgi:hypothetical protein
MTLKVQASSTPVARPPATVVEAVPPQSEQPAQVAASRDEFSKKPVKHDASAQRALKDLELHAGPTISAKELLRAIDRGTRDFDGSMAGREFRDFAQWTNAHADQLSDGAKQMMAIYAKGASAARADGHDGVSPEERARLLHRMALVNGPSTTEQTGKTNQTSPSTSKQWQAEAMKNPDHLFKRQVWDRKWNRDPDAPRYSGHCAIASLAMAVEAFGLEKKGLDTTTHSKDQDTIDAVARHMPNKFMIEKNGGHTWLTDLPGDKTAAGTYAYQEKAAAKAMGLQQDQHAGMSMSAIDQALAKGHMICLGGEAGSKYRAAEGHSFSGGHSILVVGKTDDGRFLVMDPLSRKGPTKLTRAQLADYDTRGYTSTEVWRS